jgi:hypothetical protein
MVFMVFIQFVTDKRDWRKSVSSRRQKRHKRHELLVALFGQGHDVIHHRCVVALAAFGVDV